MFSFLKVMAQRNFVKVFVCFIKKKLCGESAEYTTNVLYQDQNTFFHTRSFSVGFPCILNFKNMKTL